MDLTGKIGRKRGSTGDQSGNGALGHLSGGMRSLMFSECCLHETKKQQQTTGTMFSECMGLKSPLLLSDSIFVKSQKLLFENNQNVCCL